MSGNWLDSSKNSNLFIQSYMQGFLDISGGNLLLRNNNLIVTGGDASLNGRLIVNRDASLNRRLSIGGDASLNGRLFIANDTSLNGRLFVNSIYVGGTIVSTIIASDTSNNSRLGTNALQNTIGTNNTAAGYNAGTSNISGTNNTFLGANSNTTGSAFNQSTAIGYGTMITGSNQIIFGTATENTVFMGDISLNGNLITGSDVSMSGNLVTQGNITISTGTTFTVIGTTTGLSAGAAITSTTSNILSTNTTTYGQNWTPITATSTTTTYQSVEVSSTGQYVLACTNQGSVYASNNYGTNFIINTSSIPSTYKTNSGTYFGQLMTANSVYTIAGSGSLTSGSDNVLATTSGINYPYKVNVDSNGNIYLSDSSSKLRFVPVLSGVYFGQTMTANFIYTIAGTGTAGTGADGILATTSTLTPRGISIDSTGNVYISDTSRIRIIPKISGTYFGSSMTANFIYTLAGTTTAGSGSTGVLATTSQLVNPFGVNIDASGNIYVTDSVRIQFIPKTFGIYYGQTMTANFVYKIAGTGASGNGTNGILATTSAINFGLGEANIDSFGNLYIAEDGNSRVRFVPVTSGIYYGQTMTSNFIYTIAGTGTAGTGANGILATTSTLNVPRGVCADTNGNVYITDSTRVQFMPKNSGVYFGQTMTANYIYLLYSTTGYPAGIHLDSNNNIYFADTSNFRIKIIPVANNISYNYTSTAVSSTGQYQLACANGGSTYLSTNYGSAFTSIFIAGITSAAFSSVAVSSTGQYQVAAINPGSIYVSTNYGASFVQNTYGTSTTAAYNSMSISSTGQYMLASSNQGALYFSTNFGSSFSTVTALSTAAFTSTAISSTGQYMLTCINNGLTYISSNYGSTFNPNPVVATTAAYQSVSISSTGQYQLVTSTGSIYLSTNYGQTFTANPTGAPSSTNYQTSAISSTGKYMIVGANSGSLYLSSPPLVSTITTNLTGLVTMTDLSMSGNLYTPALVTSQVASPINNVIIQNTFMQNYTRQPLSITRVSMSDSGQYMLGLYINNSSSGSVYISKNYGQTWTDVTSIVCTISSYLGDPIIISATGQYMFVGDPYNFYNFRFPIIMEHHGQ